MSILDLAQRAKNIKKVGDCVKKKFNHNECIECKGHKEAYLNYYCEKCYTVILNEKLVTDYAKKFITKN